MPAEALEEAKSTLKFLNLAETFDALHPDGEKSQILALHTNRLCTKSYHYIGRRVGFSYIIILAGILGQLEFKNLSVILQF